MARVRPRVVVAMSGGVDSSVAAALLARAGCEVVGVTLQLYSQAQPKRKGACCAGQDILDARRVAAKLGIAHFVLDYEEKFARRVVADFAETYARGETPIPCVRCNERVKFADLLDTARDLGAEALATGHYVRRVDGPNGAELHRAADPARDQSYFLFATTRSQLEYLRFPIGDMDKHEVRAIAADLGLDVAGKPDSQDICFVPDGDYSRVVSKVIPAAPRAGEIVDESGAVLGRHDGVIRFTVGQRKGLGLSGNGEPLYVLKLDAGGARVVVGPRKRLATRAMSLREVNWLGEASSPAACAVKVRSMRPPLPARVVRGPGGTARVELMADEEAVAPGQACVFYERDGTRVLGGGWIAHTEPAQNAA
ncbi:MAG TPA: tRNA 2-thiouridine(34) synthase MnmA [Rhizomicrobium sp.]|nr:tRNA 2-thiouridine(34) synthase MnmA [Rhizomicrobium sp.]